MNVFTVFVQCLLNFYQVMEGTLHLSQNENIFTSARMKTTIICILFYTDIDYYKVQKIDY